MATGVDAALYIPGEYASWLEKKDLGNAQVSSQNEYLVFTGPQYTVSVHVTAPRIKNE